MRRLPLSMRLRYLKQEEKKASRQLYEICFPEDTPKFVDYYYREKCRDNEIIVLEQDGSIYSMIHANPFEVSCCGCRTRVHYLVAVATDPSCRRKGYMRQLLQKLLQDQWNRKEAFSFLMPASPAYYEPFGFRYWNHQCVWELDRKDTEKLYRCCEEKTGKRADGEESLLAEVSNEILQKKFDLYILRDASYYERIKKEQKSEDGDVVCLYDRNGRLTGSVCYSMEDGFETREPLFESRTVFSGEPEEIHVQERMEPLMMGRVIHLPTFVKMLRFTEVYEETLQIRDELLPDNNGCYRIYIDSTGGTAEKVEQCENARAMDIAIFGQQMFDRLKIFVNELV